MRTTTAVRIATAVVRLASTASALVLWATAVAAEPATAGCDRACLAGVADTLLASIVAHDAARLPLAADYAATENLVASAPAMMTAWRTVAAVKARHYTIDPVTQQVFVTASVVEGREEALLYGRIALRDGRIAELELYLNRSRAQSGFMFDPDGISHLPPAWSIAVAPPRRPSRAELLAAGRSMFDAAVASPPAAESCVVVETGRVAHLNAVMQATVTRDAPSRPTPTAPSAKTAPVSCEAVGHRPTDVAARADIVDEVQGEVVGIGVVRGTVSSYLMADPPESNFLPDGYYSRYRALQDTQRAKLPPGTPVLRASPSAAAVTEIFRLFDGRIQGFQRYILVMPDGIVSPWEKAR